MLTTLVGLGVILLSVVLIARSWMNKNTAIFTTTTSPQNTYSVNLKGAKGRPFLLPYAVSADVYKLGEPYVTTVLLHEAWDFMDESFELAYPEMRWVGNNVVEFYGPHDLGNDVLIVQNRSSKPVKCLSVYRGNKFLVMDLRPGASLSLQVPKTNSDSQWMTLDGVLEDGTRIRRHYETYGRRNTKEADCTYVASIFDSGATIETRMPGCQ